MRKCVREREREREREKERERERGRKRTWFQHIFVCGEICYEIEEEERGRRERGIKPMGKSYRKCECFETERKEKLSVSDSVGG